MAHLIFRLRGVPDDESVEVREVLDNARIEWYETDAGNWGISMPALWVNNADDAERARALIETYQQQRQQRIRNDNAARKTLLEVIIERPLYSIAIVVFCLALIYIMIKPFLFMFESD